MTNREYVEIFKQYSENDTEYLNAVAEFAVQFDIETTDALKIAKVVSEKKNPAIRVYKKNRNMVADKRICVNYDGNGYIGSFRGCVEFNFNARNECYSVYGLS